MTTTTNSTDIRLKQAVIAELSWQPSINSTNIGVAVRGGTVTLSGEVESYPEKLTAVKVTQRVHGVTAIAQEIEVRNRVWGLNMNDTDVARHAGEALDRAVDVPSGIKAAVHDHVITLSGEAKPFERMAAERAVKYLEGVRDVYNDVKIPPAPSVSATVVQDKISEALVRNAQIDSGRITVTCGPSGTVTLGGAVRSWDERGQAEKAAWAAPGVTAVDDQLRVAY